MKPVMLGQICLEVEHTELLNAQLKCSECQKLVELVVGENPPTKDPYLRRLQEFAKRCEVIQGFLLSYSPVDDELVPVVPREMRKDAIEEAHKGP